MTNDPQTVLITGAARGLGLAQALAFAERGWSVVATMRRPDEIDDELRANSGITVLKLDVTDQASIEAAVQGAYERLGHVDALVNNAAYCQSGCLEEVSLEQVRAQFETNVFGVMALTKVVLPQMRRQGSGHLVNVSSLGGVRALPSLNAYSASKFALEGFSEALADEVAGFGIAVTIVEPHAFKTGMRRSYVSPAMPLEEYSHVFDILSGLDDFKLGDLRRASMAIVDLAEDPSPPLRLIVGDGLEMARRKLNQQLDEYSRWESLTRSTL